MTRVERPSVSYRVH